MTKPFVGGIVQRIIVSSVMGEFSHQDEHGDDGQAIIGKNVPHICPDHSEGCLERGDKGKSQKTDQCHRKAHRDPEQEQDEEHHNNSINPDNWSLHFCLLLLTLKVLQEINR